MTAQTENQWLKDRLRDLKPKGKSLSGLADHLGLPRERISDIVAGRRRIQSQELVPMADYLDWPLEKLVAMIEDTRQRRTVPPRKPAAPARKVTMTVESGERGQTVIRIPPGEDAEELRELLRLYLALGTADRAAVRMRLKHPGLLQGEVRTGLSPEFSAYLQRLAADLAAGDPEAVLFAEADIEALEKTSGLALQLMAHQRLSLIDAELQRRALAEQAGAARARPLKKSKRSV